MADIVLRDRDGEKINYPGIEKIKLNTVDGGTAEFVDASDIPVAIENTPIELDFSNGNQTILAPEGYVVKSAIIKKPENLNPGNIAEGVDIAGIIGTLAAGGVDGVKFAAGTATGTGSSMSIPHGLGVMPDFAVVLFSSSGGSAYKNFPYRGTYIAPGVCGNANAVQQFFYSSANGYPSHKNGDSSAFQVDENTLVLGNSTYATPMNTSLFYYWFAIGGLT